MDDLIVSSIHNHYVTLLPSPTAKPTIQSVRVVYVVIIDLKYPSVSLETHLNYLNTTLIRKGNKKGRMEFLTTIQCLVLKVVTAGKLVTPRC